MGKNAVSSSGGVKGKSAASSPGGVSRKNAVSNQGGASSKSAVSSPGGVKGNKSGSSPGGVKGKVAVSSPVWVEAQPEPVVASPPQRKGIKDLPLPPGIKEEDIMLSPEPDAKSPSVKTSPVRRRPHCRSHKKPTESESRYPAGWGDRCIDQFDIICQIGEGTYGQVYKAKECDKNELVALKKVRLENEKEGFPITAVREIKILRQLCHPSIVNLTCAVSRPGGVRNKSTMSNPGGVRGQWSKDKTVEADEAEEDDDESSSSGSPSSPEAAAQPEPVVASPPQRKGIKDLPLPPGIKEEDIMLSPEPDAKSPSVKTSPVRRRPHCRSHKKPTESESRYPAGWGDRCIDQFDIICQIGEGTYGQVYKAKECDKNELVALKKVRLENEKEGFPITAVREIKILRQLCHPSIVNLTCAVSRPGGVRNKSTMSNPGGVRGQ
ncbi:CDK12 [Cordylochernes scorpioides]|uniref:CDK12 n=1 Tax=Cordylochernes scorpioides TaxID=51811 RepID=A0ABY6L3R7_9ARAC|nr:CDK12 [Cordylochernes scorpioides]